VKQTGQICIAGLAVMGEDFVLNIADKGFRVSVYNRTVSKTDHFLDERVIVIDKAYSNYHDTLLLA